MKIDLNNNIVNLRKAVAYLGEKHSWWNSNFFATTSNDFLSYIFPKTTNDNSIFFLDAVRFSIDKEVGANYYHLFRLPIEMEEQLYKNTDISKQELIITKEKALQVLEQLTSGLSVEHNNGPVNIGSSDQMNSDTIQVIAAQYYSAFINDYIVHPYLN